MPEKHSDLLISACLSMHTDPSRSYVQRTCSYAQVVREFKRTVYRPKMAILVCLIFCTCPTLIAYQHTMLRHAQSSSSRRRNAS